jgi:hypothetical protein
MRTCTVAGFVPRVLKQNIKAEHSGGDGIPAVYGRLHLSRYLTLVVTLEHVINEICSALLLLGHVALLAH